MIASARGLTSLDGRPGSLALSEPVCEQRDDEKAAEQCCEQQRFAADGLARKTPIVMSDVPHREGGDNSRTCELQKICDPGGGRHLFAAFAAPLGEEFCCQHESQ
jgi:hypothetical protein